MKTTILALVLSIMALSSPAVQAPPQEFDQHSGQAMPPMGPPEEMKQLGFLVGTWDFTMHLWLDPADTVSMTSEGTAEYEYVFGGAALMSTITQPPYLGMTFTGGSIICFDRETKRWQMAYIDDMSARLAVYSGSRTADGWVFEGENLMMGKSYLFRSTITRAAETSYDWSSEISTDGGKTWVTRARAAYTKRK